jgi:hypothetical protein
MEVNIMTFVEEGELAPVPTNIPEPPKKSSKEKWKKKKKKSAVRESEGRFVIRLKAPGSAQTVEVVEENGRLGSTAEILTKAIVHSAAEEGVVLAVEAASV